MANPTASWPLSPSRSCSSAATLPGTCTVPKTAVSLALISRGSVACALCPIGRVCGTAIGMPWTLTVRVTPKAWISCLTVAVDHAVEHQRGVGVAGPAVAVEGHRGAAPAVVDQLVDVEGGDHGVL